MKHLLILTYLISFSLIGQNKVFDTEKSNNDLYAYAEYVNVYDSDLVLQDLIKNDSLTYQQLKTGNHSVGFTVNNYWLRFKIVNNSKSSKSYYLETARPITDIANLYQISDDTISKFKSGDKIPFKDKQVKHQATIFKLILPPNEIQQIYIHLKSDGETINLPLNLYSETEFWMVNNKIQLFYGLFYGLLFLAGIIYLFFYTSLREISFWYYGIYVFSIALMQAALDGFLHEYLFPSGGYINDRAVLIAAQSSNLFLLKYCEHFLKVKDYLKSYLKGFHLAYGIIAISFLMLFITPSTLKLSYPLSNLNGLFSLLLILTTIFTMRYKRIKIDPYFSFGILFLVIGLLGFVMNNLSLLPNNFITLNSAKFGSGFEVIFLSLSMTNLIKQLRLEKEQSQAEALKKSEEISQLKTYFMSNMSHELRTPINAIMGIAENELESIEHNQSRKPYKTIINASLSLLSNVNDIIDFEKIENKQLELNPETFNPSTRLKQILENWKAQALEKGLQFTYEIDKHIPSKIYADQVRFIQIINNVLSNAVKFTEEGSVYFKLNCSRPFEHICRFSFQISDTGIGIDPKAKDDVFDSFSQMKLNHKRQYGGIGLGLTIVKHIVELFGGSLHIKSKPDEGTDVFIDLDLKSLPSNASEIVQNNNSNLSLHALIVEDNKMNQMVMRKILSSSKTIDFAIANNGQEALDMLQAADFDLILMDLQMPIMDGYEATHIIRNGTLNINKNIPIIAVTADALQETKHRVLKLGMNDYMTKPVSKDLLLEKIYALDFSEKHEPIKHEPR
ncbi:7TM diverse intracellular signaling domain-containing protein [Aestuariibaculum suncheonense]|uniref:histidine kinase n=1 Tax=Aestuariibaculum suncheonense TaxID=1028745 RepID=A0A8J6QHK2_9FLAO|nr:7TM diverse intracellular signaling domain-containing protein [Aestuariibaculum suncheonense]MBD0836570.1 response regulator [Aestuariibaculum suncheonense]